MRLSHEACAKITIIERMLSKPQLFIMTQRLHTQEAQWERRNKDIRVTWTVVWFISSWHSPQAQLLCNTCTHINISLLDNLYILCLSEKQPSLQFYNSALSHSRWVINRKGMYTVHNRHLKNKNMMMVVPINIFTHKIKIQNYCLGPVTQWYSGLSVHYHIFLESDWWTLISRWQSPNSWT
jgi:hypothetical protein